MPIEKTYCKAIPKIYRRKFEDIAMLFYVMGQTSVVPTITIQQSLYSYFQTIGDENFDIECERVKYSRLKAEFIDMKYNENTKTDSGPSKA